MNNSNLRFQYQNGRIVGAVLDLPGDKDIHIKATGLDAAEGRKLSDAFSKVSSDKLKDLTAAVQDGLNPLEAETIKAGLQNELSKAGVTGTITDVSVVEMNRPSMPGAAPKTKRPLDVFSSWLEEKTKPDGNQPKTAVEISTFAIERNSIEYKKDGREIHMSLKGLSAEEAAQLEKYMDLHPEEADQFEKMLHDVAEDLKIKAAEREWINNDTEQLLERSGVVTADVVPGSITVSAPKR